MKPAQASATARVIAAATMLLASDPRTAALSRTLLSGSRVDRWLASRDEPFTWSLVPQAMQDFLAAHRFRLVEMALTPEFSEQTAGRTSTLEGENLVLCEPIRTV
jgi:hypothetical protein